MEDISVLLHCPMEVWRRHNCVLQLYAVLLHGYRAAGLRVVVLNATYQWFYFEENDLTAF